MSFARTHISQSDALENTEKHEAVEDSDEVDSMGLVIASPVDKNQLAIDHRIEKEYDAFVVHSSADNGWVEKLEYDLTRGFGMRLYFPWRDFDGSHDSMENLIAALNQSYLVLVIVTKSYSGSERCQSVTDEALARCKDSIIRVILEKGVDVPKLGGLWKVALFDVNVREGFFRHLADLMSRQLC